MGSLNVATTTGPGASVDLVMTRLNAQMTTVVTGAPAAAVVRFEGSLDGTNWTLLGTSVGSAVSNELPKGSPVHDVVISNGVPVRYARANLLTLTGNGATAPNVSAAIQVLP